MSSKPYIKELDRYNKESDRYSKESKEVKDFYNCSGLFASYRAEIEQEKGGEK